MQRESLRWLSLRYRLYSVIYTGLEWREKNFDDKCYNQCSSETSENENEFDTDTGGTSARIHQGEGAQGLPRRGRRDHNESEQEFDRSASFNHGEKNSSNNAGGHSCEPIWDNVSDSKARIKASGIVNHQESENEDHLMLDMGDDDIKSKSLRPGIISWKDHQLHRIYVLPCLAIIILVTALIIFSLG